jgi:uncharacterized membrane protein
MSKYFVAFLLCLLLLATSAFAGVPAKRDFQEEARAALPAIEMKDAQAYNLVVGDEVAEDPRSSSTFDEDERDVTIDTITEVEWSSSHDKILKRLNRNFSMLIGILIVVCIIAFLIIVSMTAMLVYWIFYTVNPKTKRSGV